MRAGAQHQVRQIAGGVHRGRQRITAQAAVQRVGAGLLVQHQLLAGHKGQAVVVQQAVQHDAQRVDVHPAVVVGAAGHFRCHVVIGALDGLAAPGAGQLARDAEIAQLEEAELVDEDVLGLDVAVDDLLFLADLQRRADVDAQTDDLGLREGAGALPVVEGGEQLHADVDIPADLAGALHHLVVLDADDVLDALQGLHELDLVDEVIHDALQVGAGAVLGHAVRAQGFHLRSVLRDGDHLDGGAAGQVVVTAHGLVDRAVGTAADPLHDLPFGPDLFNFLGHVWFLLH